MAVRAGYIGQIKGAFGTSTDVLAQAAIPPGYKIKFGVSIDPYDLMPIPEWYFEVNNQHIKLGKTGMYEIDSPMFVSSFTLPLGGPPSTIIDFVIYD